MEEIKISFVFNIEGVFSPLWRNENRNEISRVFQCPQEAKSLIFHQEQNALGV